jgi:hypothetical protein
VGILGQEQDADDDRDAYVRRCTVGVPLPVLLFIMSAEADGSRAGHDLNRSRAEGSILWSARVAGSTGNLLSVLASCGCCSPASDQVPAVGRAVDAMCLVNSPELRR